MKCANGCGSKKSKVSEWVGESRKVNVGGRGWCRGSVGREGVMSGEGFVNGCGTVR